LSFNFSVLASEFEFAIALGEDVEVAPGKPIGRGNIADGRMQPHGVVMVNEAFNKSCGIRLGKRATRPEAISFKALVPAFDFPVGIGRELHPMQRIQNGIFT
jgi:hypothetical protein